MTKSPVARLRTERGVTTRRVRRGHRRRLRLRVRADQAADQRLRAALLKTLFELIMKVVGL